MRSRKYKWTKIERYRWEQQKSIKTEESKSRGKIRKKNDMRHYIHQHSTAANTIASNWNAVNLHQLSVPERLGRYTAHPSVGKCTMHVLINTPLHLMVLWWHTKSLNLIIHSCWNAFRSSGQRKALFAHVQILKTCVWIYLHYKSRKPFRCSKFTVFVFLKVLS